MVIYDPQLPGDRILTDDHARRFQDLLREFLTSDSDFPEGYIGEPEVELPLEVLDIGGSYDRGHLMLRVHVPHPDGIEVCSDEVVECDQPHVQSAALSPLGVLGEQYEALEADLIEHVIEVCDLPVSSAELSRYVTGEQLRFTSTGCFEGMLEFNFHCDVPAEAAQEADTPQSDRNAEFTPDTGDPEIDELDPPPITFTGAFEFEPRNAESYPSTGDGVEEMILASFSSEADERTKILNEEFTLQKEQAVGEPVPEIPPKPLTVEELDDVISRLDTYDPQQSAVWVPCEHEYVEKLAVGEYRDHVEGYILQFQVERDDQLWHYVLVPDYSQTGFSWYVSDPTTSITTEGQLDMAQSRRLHGLLELSNPEEVLNPPDDILNASSLLDTTLIRGDMSATPTNWVTTSCTPATEEQDFLFPRFNATFVHETSGAVVEVIPLPANKSDEFYRDALTGSGTPGANPHKLHDSTGFGTPTRHDPDDTGGQMEDAGHRWELHYVSEDTVDVINAEFEKEVTGKELKHLLRKLDSLLESDTNESP